jgi:hypothetical protein
MIRLLRPFLAIAMLGSAFSPASAQLSAPSMISALPDIKSISPANAAGVLQYCVKNNLVSSSATDGVLAPLTAKTGIKSSPDFSAGQAGTIVTGGKTFALGQANDYLKSQACDKVFRQARHFK